MNRVCTICGCMTESDRLGAGHALDEHGHAICYDCCGLLDERRLVKMKRGEYTKLYFEAEIIMNWPGTFRVRANGVRVSVNNWGFTRTDGWFFVTDKNGNRHDFHFIHVGDSHQLATCLKLGIRK